jgi:hypothetical protein
VLEAQEAAFLAARQEDRKAGVLWTGPEFPSLGFLEAQDRHGVIVAALQGRAPLLVPPELAEPDESWSRVDE